MAQIRSKQIADFLASVNWSNVSANDIANASDIKSYVDGVEAALAADVNASIDSIESGLSTEIVATNGDVDAANDSIDSLESALSTELVDRASDVDAEELRATTEEARIEGLLNDEIARAGGAEGELADSVDSLESALSTEIVETNGDVQDLKDMDTDLSAEINVERGRIDTILAGADVDLDQFSEIVSFTEAIDLENDNQFASYVLANDGINAGQNASIDSLESALSTEVDSIDTRLGDVSGNLVDSVDSMESALSTELVDRASDVDAEELRATTEEARIEGLLNDEIARAGGAEGELADSVDSLESALSAEIVATNGDVDAANDSIDSLESALSTELVDRASDVDAEELRATTEEARIEGLLNDEIARAGGAEGELADSVDSLESALSTEVDSIDTRLGDVSGNLVDSVDSLESALSTEIVETNGDVQDLKDMDTDLSAEINVERGRIDTILAGADVDLDQFSEIVSFTEAIDLENDNQFASYVLANDGINAGQNASIDSLESALSAEIVATNGDVSSLEIVDGTLADSVDSLESALSAEIVATNLDVSSLETAIANEATARVLGDTYAEATVTGVVEAAGFVAVNVPTHEFQMGAFDTEVYVNGLRVAFTQEGPQDFTLSVNYPIEATDIIRFVGVGNEAIA